MLSKNNWGLTALMLFLIVATAYTGTLQTTLIVLPNHTMLLATAFYSQTPLMLTIECAVLALAWVATTVRQVRQLTRRPTRGLIRFWLIKSGLTISYLLFISLSVYVGTAYIGGGPMPAQPSVIGTVSAVAPLAAMIILTGILSLTVLIVPQGYQVVFGEVRVRPWYRRLVAMSILLLLLCTVLTAISQQTPLQPDFILFVLFFLIAAASYDSLANLPS